MTKEPSSPPRGLSETTRIEAFSDGVFAIAITLLVLEIKVPDPEHVGQGGLMRHLIDLWPSHLGYVISFVTLGIMWANHHAVFNLVAQADRYFMLINVAFLMCISYLPVPTAVLAEYLPDAGERHRAVAFYSAALFLIAIAYNALWWYAAGRRLLDRSADPVAVRNLTRRYAVGPFAYGTSIGLAFLNAWASLGLHALLAALYLLPERKQRLPQKPPARPGASRSR